MKNIKKLLALLCLVALLLAFTACGNKDVAEDDLSGDDIPAEETGADEEVPDELPMELIGSWQLDTERGGGDLSASLTVDEDFGVSFFLGGGRDGEGEIKMEEGRAVATTRSYLEGVEESFVLTPEEYQGKPCVKMEYQGDTFYWVAAVPSHQAPGGHTAKVDAEFEDCLDNISRVQLGTSVAFMTALEQAAALMDWAEGTSMTASDVMTAFSAKLGSLDNQAKATYLMQLEQVDGAYQQLLTSGQEDVLASAGLTDTGYPWGNDPLPAVEALMTAAGLR